MKKTAVYKFMVFLVSVVSVIILSAILLKQMAAAGTNLSTDEYKSQLAGININGISFSDYIKNYDVKRKPDAEYIIEAKDYVRVEGMEVRKFTDFHGMDGISVYTGEKGFIEYEVDIKEEGFYNISILYYPVEGKSAAIQRAIFIDGVLPYRELSLVEFPRIFVNERDEWLRDNRGNDLKPRQVEAPQWITGFCYDSEGYETKELAVYLGKGIHTITLYSLREPMVIRKIILSNTGEVLPYDLVKEKYDAGGATDTSGHMVRIEAEHANRKSSPMLYPTQDRSSPAVSPYDAKELRNNTIGSNGNWKIVGQWLEWDFEVPESGYYYITLHARQNFVRGIYTSRKIMIDGKVPFEEMSDYGFKYYSGWRLITLGDENGENFKFYLEKGKHVLRMEVVLGDFSRIVSRVEDIVKNLNAIYRKVIRITGVEPDKYRDYHIEKNIPGIVEEFKKERNSLAIAMEELRAVAGTGSDREAALNTMLRQLDYVIADVERLPKILTSFKIDISALGNWITGVLEQPLALDTIYIHSPDVQVPKPNNSLLARIVHTIKSLFYSFVIDYNAIGNVAEEGEDVRTITVWIGSGRDQANVLKSLIDESFTPQTNINVNLELVDMGMLLQATLAGQGPDVAVQVSSDIPVNYGMRNAVVDLSQFPDLEEVKRQFRESAMVPYEFDGHVFALPETETCLMMFYRKDILDELGLEVPVTWDEMKEALSVLSKNQMDVGMLPSEQVFAMLLYQSSGQYYNENSTASVLNSDTAVRAFKEYCKFYTDYRLDRETPVDQRFRTGEAPIVIADYTLYNQLQVSAPDIKGLWGFTMVPGTVREDGTVDHSVPSAGSAVIMMSRAKDKKAAWEFMKWWVSAETQIRYGREMEALMGAAARHPTANIEAFESLPWPTEDYDALKSQFEWLKGIPQVPGSYYTWRNVNNAFYRVVIAEDKNKMQPREALTEYVRYINDEITFKRKEFGLPTDDDLKKK